MSLDQALELRKSDEARYVELSLATMADQVGSMLEFQRQGAHVFDYGNNLREGAKRAGVAQAFDFPGFVPAYIRPLFCQGSGPFRWVALSGDPTDIYETDRALQALFPQDKKLANWLDKAREMVAFQGLPSRICWLRYGQREQAGLLFNQLVREKKVRAPIVIGRDHLDCGSVASPYRETEAMEDGSDAVSDWPLLNALINSVNGATWTSFHHGGGVGIGYSQHAGMVICADGTEEMELRLRRVLNSDPGMGIVRHADAGYELAREWAGKNQYYFSLSCPIDSLLDDLPEISHDGRQVIHSPHHPSGNIFSMIQPLNLIQAGKINVQIRKLRDLFFDGRNHTSFKGLLRNLKGATI